MITTTENNTKATGKEFTIKASPKAFKILSDKLYTDKYRAIVRELSTNAYDSHIEAGKKDVPFQITLPSEKNKDFVIRDFGVGMSEEKIMNLYSSYFDSDKTDSNLYVGALGLGSKSPFAYTHTFKVVSYYEGKEMVFEAKMNEGIPVIEKIDEKDSDEPTGIKIYFEVPYYYINFWEATRKVLRPFETKPTIVNIDEKPFFDWKIDEYDTIIKDRKWLINKTSTYGVNDIVAVQGNVEYKVDPEIFEDKSFRSNINNIIGAEFSFKDVHNFFRRNNVIIFFDIGDLDVAPSRESLSFDQKTIKNLSSRVALIYKDIRDNVLQNILDKEDTKYGAFEAYRKILRELNLNHEVIKELTWKGELITDALTINNAEAIEIWSYEQNYNGTAKAFCFSKVESFLDFAHVKGKIRIFYIDEDKKKSAKFRIKQHIRAYRFTAIVVTDKSFFNEAGIKKYELSSNVDYIKKPGSSNKSSVTGLDRPLADVYQVTSEKGWKGHVEEVTKNDWDDSEYAEGEKVFIIKVYNDYYLSYDENTLEPSGPGLGMFDVKRLSEKLIKNLDKDELYIYIIKKGDWKHDSRIKKDRKNWTSFSEFSSNSYNDLLEKREYKNLPDDYKKVALYESFGINSYSTSGSIKIAAFLNENYELPEGLKEVVQYLINIKNMDKKEIDRIKNMKQTVVIARNFGNKKAEDILSKIEKIQNNTSYKFYEDKLYAYFPMLQYVNSNLLNQEVIIDYIESQVPNLGPKDIVDF